MPIHDWTRVRANRFHDFHVTWTVHLAAALNGGRLPKGYFALLEQRAHVRENKFGACASVPSATAVCADAMSTVLHPPRTRFVSRTKAAEDARQYARKANRVTVRHPDGDVVAVIEIVSPGNKSTRHALHTFARKAVAFLEAGIHLLIVDLFPPSRRDPRGIHKVIWDRLQDEDFALPDDKPLTLAAYAAGTEITAYIEPVAVGDRLPEMPVFLTPETYVPCPLEESYQTAWEQFPAPFKGPLENRPGT